MYAPKIPVSDNTETEKIPVQLFEPGFFCAYRIGFSECFFDVFFGFSSGHVFRGFSDYIPVYFHISGRYILMLILRSYGAFEQAFFEDIYSGRPQIAPFSLIYK